MVTSTFAVKSSALLLHFKSSDHINRKKQNCSTHLPVCPFTKEFKTDKLNQIDDSVFLMNFIHVVRVSIRNLSLTLIEGD